MITPRNCNHRPPLTPAKRDGIIKMKLDNARSVAIRDAFDVTESEINRVWAAHRAANPTVQHIDQRKLNKK